LARIRSLVTVRNIERLLFNNVISLPRCVFFPPTKQGSDLFFL